MLRKLLLIAAAAIGGIYLTSEEGGEARVILMKNKAIFEPIVKDLLKQASEVLEGSKKMNSDEVRANIDLLVKEAKKALIEINLDKTIEEIRKSIKVASEKIRKASFQTELELTKKVSKKSIEEVTK